MDNFLREHLQTFETFFQAIGFKQRQGRVWGYLVLAGQPLSAAAIAADLGMSAGSVSDSLGDLREWTAVTSEYSSEQRCQLHSAVSDTLAIVTTILRRREALAVHNFKESAKAVLQHVQQVYGPKDSRVETLKSIVDTSEITEATIQFFVAASSAVPSGDESRLARVVRRMTAIGMKGANEISKLAPSRRKAAAGDRANG